MNCEQEQEAIARQVETLAANSLVETEPDPERWISSLRDLGAAAERAGGVGLAKAARELAFHVERQEPRTALEAGILELQSALEAWQREASATAASPAQEPLPLAQDPELLSDFIVESREHLDSVEARLLEIERDPANPDAIHSIFRSFHTVKGLAGFLELHPIRDVAHEIETVLDRVREGRLSMSPEVVDLVLASLDYLNGCVRVLEAAGPGTASVFADNSALLVRVRGLLEARNTGAPPCAAEAAPAEVPSPVQPAPQPVESASPAARGRSRSVKIDTEKLDYLVDMVGEMVIAQSLIRYDPDLRLEQQPRLSRNLSQLARITDDVQRTAMSMRMVPIASLFQKMARLVRDLARKAGKEVLFESIGDDVELDRNIVEELGDPLMHMIRNAVDHGVESPEDRVRAGKDAAAKIVLRAMHEAGQIVIQVSDDGRGLDRDKILAKARARGLVNADGELSEAELLNLIFHPGFSTAEKVSDVSGRGVGMDVVRKQIQKLRGSIDIQTAAGRGTTFSLKLPLTLAIIDGLVVAVGSHRYVVPIFAVKEMFRPASDTVFTVENRSEMVLVRERLVPVIRLYQKFGVEPRTTVASEAVLVLAEADSRLFCLMVDTVLGKQEIVIKSLGSMFQKVRGVAGGAILGDGHVALILDTTAIFGVLGEAAR